MELAEIEIKEKVELKNFDLINISDSLTYLASKETSAWYEVGKNLRALKPFMKEVEGLREDIRNNCAKKDKNGQVVTETINGITEIVWKSVDAKIEQQSIWTKFIEEDARNIDWHTFSITKLEDLKLNGGLLSNLIDIIIVD